MPVVSGRLGWRWIVVVMAVSLFGLVVTGAPAEEGGASPSLAQGPVPGAGPGPLRAGQIQEIDLRVGRNKIHHPGASYIKVHFAQLDLGPGDVVTVSDPGGTQIRTYPGGGYTTDDRGGFWALSVAGDTVLVELHSQDRDAAGEGDASAPVVVVDIYAYGYPLSGMDAGFVQPESICGLDDRQDVVCLEPDFPVEYERSGAVARLLIDGTYFCTAWRTGPLNRVFTNQHCISSQADVESTEVWFNYQRPTCGGVEPIVPTIVAANKLLAASPELDYALFTVSQFSAIVPFGYLDLDVRAPILNEQIYIPQHGGGRPKEFGIYSDLDAENRCRINDESILGTDTGYYCDTFGGSSGAPVLARSSHRVIAIHHSGVYGLCGGTNMNQAVRIDRIWPQVSSWFEMGDPSGDVRINELDLWTFDGVELYNVGSQAVDMTEWQLLTYGANGALEVEYTLPVFMLQPASYVVLREGSGSNTTSVLYMNQEISWVSGGGGAALLLGSQGSGVDFVRFGDSAVPPAGGAAWGGVNPLSPPSAQSLGRGVNGRDTDDGCDWCAQASSMGTANPGCVRPQIQVTPLDLQEILYPGQVTTRTVTIRNSGPVTLVFQIDQFLTGCMDSGPQFAPADAGLLRDESEAGLGLDDVSWLRAVPISGTVSSMAQVDVAVVIDAAGLPVGDRGADLYIYSNDADHTPLIVPVTVHVRSLLYLPLVLSAGP